MKINDKWIAEALLLLLLLLAFLPLSSCATEADSVAAPHRFGLIGDTLTGADADDFGAAFDAAACFCEAQTVDFTRSSAPVVTPGSSGLAGDPVLSDWAERRRAGEFACSDLGNRPAQPVATSGGNGCALAPTTSGAATITSEFPMVSLGRYPAGLCRPEMNYCLGQELSRRAHSLASAPRSRAVRDALLGEAASRFEAAGVEMASVTAFLGDFCVGTSETDIRTRQLEGECKRLEGDATHGSYADHAFSVIGDSVMQLGDLVDELAQSAHEAGDAVAPGLARSPGAYVDDVWGRDSARYRAMQVLMGSDDDGLVAFGRADGSGSRDSLDGLYADRVEADDHVRLALELMVAYDIPFGVLEGPDGRRVLSDPEAVPGVTAEGDLDTALYNLLDRRIAASLNVGPCALANVPEADLTPAPGGEVPLPQTPGAALRRREPMALGALLAFASGGDTGLCDSAGPLLLADSALRSQYGLRVSHVRAALRLARNMLDTMEGDIQTRPQVTGLALGNSLVTVSWPLLRLRPTMRLASALSNVSRDTGTGFEIHGLSADPLALNPLAWSDGSTRAASGTVPNLYDLDLPRLRRMGAAGALAVLRVHLARLAHAGLIRAPELAIDTTALESTRALVSSYIGDVWTSYTRYDDAFCPCIAPTNPDLLNTCDILANQTGGYLNCQELTGFLPRQRPLENEGRLDVFYPIGDAHYGAVSGDRRQPTAVLVRSEDEAYCLRYGHRPDGTDPDCHADPVAYSGFLDMVPSYTELAELRTDIRPSASARPLPEELLDVSQRRFVVPHVGAYGAPRATNTKTATAYILWRTPSPDGSFRYELLDVIQPARDASLHALGGRYGRVFAELDAKDPIHPGRPIQNALDLSYDLIPPLENELTSDGDAIEDSYQTYLTNAEISASRASSLLRDARAQELESLRNDRADSAMLEQAALAEQETIATSCGEPGGCDVDVVPQIALSRIFVDGHPIVSPMTPAEVDVMPAVLVGPDGHATRDGEIPVILIRDKLDGRPVNCGEHLGGFTTHFDLEQSKPRHWDWYVSDYLGGGLGCMRYLLRLAASQAVLHRVPRMVLAELARGGDGQFTDVRGQVRGRMIEMFQNLRELDAALRGFEATYEQALAEVGVGAQRIDNAIPGHTRRLMCKLGKALVIIGSVVAAAAAIASAVLTVGTTGVLIAVLLSTGAASGAGAALINEVNNNKCSGDTGAAQAEAQRTFGGAILSLENLRGVMDEVRRTTGRLGQGDLALEQLRLKAEIAGQRHAIERRLIDANALSDLPSWRALQGFRVRRAWDQTHRAQQYAFVARRAIEFRLGVDLSTMPAPELFTPPPASWANDLFTVSTASSADGTGASGAQVNTTGEALEDYVTRLGDFVRGYPFARRFRDTTDVQLLRLSRMGERLPPEGETSEPFATRALYKCAGLAASSIWDPLVQAEPCDGPAESGVDYAELRFAIPARLQGYLADRLSTGNFNYRHQRVAVNLVGAALVDCRLAPRPGECFGDGNLQFSLRQEGDVLLEDFEREQRIWPMEPGVILRARALNAERVLTNPLSSADRALVTPYERTEFWGRPLRGTYTLRIHGRPEVQWSQLEDVQILLDYRYWTRQE